MKRHGAVLLSVLWVIVVVSAVAASAFVLARDGQQVSANRIRLTQSEWAREACAELMRARIATDRRKTFLDTVDLGAGMWCTAAIENPEALLNLNTATAQQLRRLLAADSLVSALLDWRDPDSITSQGSSENAWYRERSGTLPRNGPLAAVEELYLIRGFDSTTVRQVSGLTTVIGDGAVDLADATQDVIMIATGWSRARSVAELHQMRLNERRMLPIEVKRDGTLRVMHVVGGVRGTPIVTSGTIVSRLAGTQLAVLWQEMP